jgi:hypothetical protein
LIILLEEEEKEEEVDFDTTDFEDLVKGGD